MLDNDIDQLFKSSLEDFEVSPAANSWDKITDGLDQKPKTKKYPIFWMAAASVLLVATLGITLFNQETDVIKLHGNQTKDLAALEQPVEKQFEDVPFDMECHLDSEGHRYDFGFGMNWKGVIQDERAKKYK